MTSAEPSRLSIRNLVSATEDNLKRIEAISCAFMV